MLRDYKDLLSLPRWRQEEFHTHYPEVHFNYLRSYVQDLAAGTTLILTSGGHKSSKSQGAPHPDNTSVFVGGLKVDTVSEGMLRTIFNCFGPVKDVSYCGAPAMPAVTNSIGENPPVETLRLCDVR
jgi:hypothetical protein